MRSPFLQWNIQKKQRQQQQKTWQHKKVVIITICYVKELSSHRGTVCFCFLSKPYLTLWGKTLQNMVHLGAIPHKIFKHRNLHTILFYVSLRNAHKLTLFLYHAQISWRLLICLEEPEINFQKIPVNFFKSLLNMGLISQISVIWHG